MAVYLIVSSRLTILFKSLEKRLADSLSFYMREGAGNNAKTRRSTSHSLQTNWRCEHTSRTKKAHVVQMKHWNNGNIYNWTENSPSGHLWKWFRCVMKQQYPMSEPHLLVLQIISSSVSPRLTLSKSSSLPAANTKRSFKHLRLLYSHVSSTIIKKASTSPKNANYDTLQWPQTQSQSPNFSNKKNKFCNSPHPNKAK